MQGARCKIKTVSSIEYQVYSEKRNKIQRKIQDKKTSCKSRNKIQNAR